MNPLLQNNSKKDQKTFTDKIEISFNPQEDLDLIISQFTFLLESKPDLSKFQKYLRSWETSLDDVWLNEIYGGSVLDPTRVEFSSHEIKNPLRQDLGSISYEDFEDPSLFGYFVIKNIKMQEQNTLSTFVDFWILASDIQS